MKLNSGDIVLLRSGRIVQIEDIKNNYIVVASDEWYPIEEVERVIKKIEEENK